jgi:AcrR family transcriptional regulator
MPRKRPVQQTRARRTRDDLLEAAGEVFANQGYPGATIDDITAIAGVSKGAFYFHFESKEDVFVALVQGWASDVSTQVKELSRSGRLERSGLRTVIDRLLSVGGSRWRPRLVLEFLSQAEHNSRVGEALVEAQDAWRAATSKVVSKARRAGLVDEGLSPDATAAALLAIRDGLIVQACLPGSSREIDVRSATRVALALLQPPRVVRRTG